MPEEKQHSRLLPGSNSPSDASRRIPLWQALVLPLAAIFFFFLLLEGGLALFGVKPALQTEDPFVGFAANTPLFLPARGPDGKQILSTAPHMYFFNRQEFIMPKPPNTVRIFCLGGSTTYGRPYNDATSFSSWLRELLPLIKPDRNWEVINAGGISYASYRVAHLMEELIHYQPDLFIIYTGHNEFLEERTYGRIKEIPEFARSLVSQLARTRTWNAMTTALQGLNILPEPSVKNKNKLAVEVNAILDKSAGLDPYTRDDELKKNILNHYQLSLERMVLSAQSINARVILVTPASNLKDCSPFKSEHTEGLTPASRQQTENMLNRAREKIEQEKLQEALNLLATATALDPRHAELQYLRGKALLVLERFQDAGAALHLARDEDVCPLRALTPMRTIVQDIAQENGTGLVDYIEILEQDMLLKTRHNIPGEELFLDHVHPTIEGHKILAKELINSMIAEGLLQPSETWGDKDVAIVEEKIMSQVDVATHGLALANLARVLLWAGKVEDADRLGKQALETANDDKQVITNATATLAVISLHQGKPEQALAQLYAAIEKVPESGELRLKLGQILAAPPFAELEKATAHLLVARRQMPEFDGVYDLFGIIMAKRGRLEIAYLNLMQALQLNPNNSRAYKALEQIRPLLERRIPDSQPTEIILEAYPSDAPHKLTTLRTDREGRKFRDSIEVEFHENGRLKRFMDISKNKPNGIEITWDTAGRMLSRKEY